MSFVSRLRMASMFPINSDLGNAGINVPNDNYDEIINQALASVPFNRGEMLRPNGLTAVANMRNQPTNNLKFGGMIDSGSNPGADILNRAKINAERIYSSYGQPLNAPVKGPSNDEVYAANYFDRLNKEKLADAAVINAKGNANYRQAQLDNQEERLRNEGERINLTRDKNKTQAELDQTKFDLTKSKEENKQKEIEEQKIARQNAIQAGVESSLEEINNLLTPDNQLTPEAARATGWTSFGNFIPGSKGLKGSTSINRLKNTRVLDLIAEMKAQSKTGATGFGQMNLRELGVLEKAATKLNTRLDDEDFRQELVRIKELLQKASANSTNQQDFEVLIDPNGVPRQIPKDKIEEALRRGARRQ